jgi:alginate O-acetyltransferase complex protein AlgI
MVFSSAVFLFVFLPCVLLGYYLIKSRYRNVFLIASNLFFYAWGGPEFVLVMITSIIINYVSGILIDRAHNTLFGKYRAFVLAVGICANLGMLFYYKYFVFTVLNAYSDRFRPAIPDEAGHPFRLIPATDSGASRPPIPDDSGHLI